MKQTTRHIFFSLIATLFVASTVYCIIDDKHIDRSRLNYTDFHACYATNCPVCGAQYQAQFETEHVQKGITLDSKSICALLDLAYQMALHKIDFPHDISTHDVSSDGISSPQPALLSAPLRI